MQKLGLNVLKKLIDVKATAAEIDVLLWIARKQNSHGVVEGVYYKTICDELELSYQTFYNAKSGLVKKGIITTEKRNYQDYDVVILDNDFSTKESFEKGYLNTGYAVFTCKQFRDMTAGEKLLTMDIMTNNLASGASFHVRTKKFIKEYSDKYRICTRTLQSYLKTLRLIFSIGIKKRQYYFTLRSFAKKKDNGEEETYRKNLIEVGLRRNKIKNASDQDRKYLLKDILQRYTKNINDMIGHFSLSDVITESLEKLNAGLEEKKWERHLQLNLVHRLTRIKLGLPVKELKFGDVR